MKGTLIALLLTLTLTTVAFAGGWAIITLNEFPDYAVAGKPLNLTFSVRQHGVTLLPGLQPKVQATTTSGLMAKAGVKPTANRGEYTTSLTLPQSGEWTIKISSGFNDSNVTLPASKSSRQAPQPRPPSRRPPAECGCLPARDASVVTATLKSIPSIRRTRNST